MAWRVDAEIAGGNGIVERIEGDTVYVRPDLRDTEGNWFYWCLRVRGGEPGRTLRFVFTAQEPIAARGAAVSNDHGKTWRWLGKDAGGRSGFAYRFSAGEEEVWFSMGVTYTQGHWERFVAGLRGGAESGVLCRSTKGRAVEMLRVGAKGGPVKVLVTARHHACEMMANYAVEGIIAGALGEGGGNDVGRWWQEHVDLVVVPFVDKDGAEEGDQGKNRRPHDHGRDYEAGIYPETRAIKEFVAGWMGKSGAGVVLDMHCPWIYNGCNEMIFQPGVEDGRGWMEQQQFARALGACARGAAVGALPYQAGDDLAFGLDWNTVANMGRRLTLPGWALASVGVRLATVIELPYAEARGAEVNAETARGFGRDVAAALKGYWQGAEKIGG